MTTEGQGRPPRAIRDVERSECGFCRVPIDVVTTIGPGSRSTRVFEAGSATRPHACPREALIRFRQLVRLARLGDPRGMP